MLRLTESGLLAAFTGDHKTAQNLLNTAGTELTINEKVHTCSVLAMYVFA